eukprot:764957-Hanusia_phi.AAC.5
MGQSAAKSRLSLRICTIAKELANTDTISWHRDEQLSATYTRFAKLRRCPSSCLSGMEKSMESAMPATSAAGVLSEVKKVMASALSELLVELPPRNLKPWKLDSGANVSGAPCTGSGRSELHISVRSIYNRNNSSRLKLVLSKNHRKGLTEEGGRRGGREESRKSAGPREGGGWRGVKVAVDGEGKVEEEEGRVHAEPASESKGDMPLHRDRYYAGHAAPARARPVLS